MAGTCPWKISAFICACCEFVLATFLIFHLALASLVFEVAEYILPVARSCSCSTPRRHGLNCSADVSDYSSSHSCNVGRKFESSSGSSRGRISRGLLAGRTFSEDLSRIGDGLQCVVPSGRAASSSQASSTSLSSAYRRKVMEEGGPECQRSFSVSDIELTDDQIEEGAEWIKQQMELGNDDVILNLLKAFQAERNSLRVLHQEFEEERVAAETAAKEAMAMILRLQEEKSALQMKAAHYQRIAEEKALHYEQAIQFLVEDLCRKEGERLLLEEELRSLSRVSFADGAVQQENELCLWETSKEVLLLKGVDEAPGVNGVEEMEGIEIDPPYPGASKPYVLLKGDDEASKQGVGEEVEGVVSSLDDVNLNHHVASDIDGSIKIEPPEDVLLDSYKSFVLLANGHMDDTDALQPVSETVADPSERAAKPLVASDDEEDDAASILVQLSAVEKQLQALEESKSWSLPDHYLTISKLATNGPWKALCNGDDEAAGVLTQGNHGTGDEGAGKLFVGNTDFPDIADEEKVVTIDVASGNGRLHQDSTAGKEGILEFKGIRCAENEHLDTIEVEKHLDVPSFIPRNQHPYSFTMRTSLETCKLEGQSLVPGRVSSCEEENWDHKNVSLEDIHLRLQALESESTLLRQTSIPSSSEHMTMVLLSAIVQELHELLKARRIVAAVDEVSPPSDFSVTGGLLKKRHYADGPGG